MRQFVASVVILGLGACGLVPGLATRPEPQMQTPDAGTVRPEVRPVQPSAVPSGGAQTAEALDTTSAAERAEAAAAGGGAVLGRTIAALGDVAEPGFWLKTPLVKARTTGKVEYPRTGLSAQVDLFPLDGPPTAGSQISLSAMRLIGAPLTGLPELVVYGP